MFVKGRKSNFQDKDIRIQMLGNKCKDTNVGQMSIVLQSNLDFFFKGTTSKRDFCS